MESNQVVTFEQVENARKMAESAYYSGGGTLLIAAYEKEYKRLNALYEQQK